MRSAAVGHICYAHHWAAPFTPLMCLGAMALQNSKIANLPYKFDSALYRPRTEPRRLDRAPIGHATTTPSQ